MKIFEFQIKFHWDVFLRAKLTICQHWFRQWLGAVQATGHYLNQCCLSSPTHICGTRGRYATTPQLSRAKRNFFDFEFWRQSLRLRILIEKSRLRNRYLKCFISRLKYTFWKFSSKFVHWALIGSIWHCLGSVLHQADNKHCLTDWGRVPHTWYMGPSLLQIINCPLLGAKPLAKPMLAHCNLGPRKQTSVKCNET